MYALGSEVFFLSESGVYYISFRRKMIAPVRLKRKCPALKWARQLLISKGIY
jgi:hypothetical protein